jgi:pyruvate carboxylase
MRVSINAVRKYGKVAEVAVCFSGDFLNPEERVYTLEYYRKRAAEVLRR